MPHISYTKYIALKQTLDRTRKHNKLLNKEQREYADSVESLLNALNKKMSSDLPVNTCDKYNNSLTKANTALLEIEKSITS